MAVLETFPDQASVMAMRGLVDYYEWKGLYVARGWPRYKPHERSAAELETTIRFRQATIVTGALPTQVVAIYKDGLEGTGVTWIDRFRALALGRAWIDDDHGRP